MRIFNRAHVPWAIFVLAATLFATWLYLGNFEAGLLPSSLRLPDGWVQKPSDHRSVGGTPLGLAFGAISLAVFIFAALLGVRKKLVLWRIGTVQRWLRAHIWLSLLTVPLVLLHSGFRFGGGMTTLLVLLYAIVMVSGFYGLALQHQIPHLMKERLPAESVYEQIPHIRRQLYAAAEKMRNSLIAAPAETVTAGSTPMASTTADLSTPTARAKTVTGSSITAEPVSAPAPPKTEEKIPPGPRPADHKPPETMGTPTARVPEGAPVPSGTQGVAEVAPPEVIPRSVTPPSPIASSAATPGEKAPGAAITQPAVPKPPAPAVAAAKLAVNAPPTDAASEASLLEFLDRTILPYLQARRGDRMPLGNARFSEDTFRFVKLRVTPAYRDRVEEIRAWCDERRMLDLQVKLQHWLHGWLFIHAPVSFLLLILTIWHACVTLFYY